MSEAIEQMLKKKLGDKKATSLDENKNALKEIIQEVALLGLWRSKFFEHAAFYGGTCLRIFYGLNRYSEDLDFSLLTPDKDFSLKRYFNSVKDELESLGLKAKIEESEGKGKEDSQVQSAFIKSGTRVSLLNIDPTGDLGKKVQNNELLKVKFEIDIDPPLDFQTENKTLLQPIPFSVKNFSAEDLFAGKMHALLYRGWGNRVKGRDWYDFVWFIGRGIPVNINHLKSRMVQSGHWKVENELDLKKLKELFIDKIEKTDLDGAKVDVRRFLVDQDALKLWNKDFFIDLAGKIKAESG